MTSDDDFIISLPDLAVIEVRGDDAIAFLQGQLTNDIASLDGENACLAGYCSAKGRLLASMVVWRDQSPDDPVVCMLTKADLADALVKRLSLYVLRAKVKLSRSSKRVFGVVPAPSPDRAHVAPWRIARHADGTSVMAPAAGGQVRQWLVSATAAPSAHDNAQSWQCGDIAAGIPWIQAATQDLFIPQTLNLDLIGAVSFTKGCYPGQEVVARSHYRGTVKRRMARGVISDAAGLDEAALAASDTFDAKRPEAPCGRVVNAAMDTAGSLHVLMEVQLADLNTADFRLGSGDGPAIMIQALPYSIQEN